MKLDPKAKQRLTLDFKAKGRDEDELHLDISCVAQSGSHLWLGSDETVAAERLTWDGKKAAFNQHAMFDLTDFFKLPASSDEEIDIEGMVVNPPYLWITGSHSLKRGKAEGESFEDAIKELTKIERETNRYFLARVPLVRSTDKSSEYELLGTAVDPSAPDQAISACRLFGTGATSVLTDSLRFDELLKPYLDIPSKDNGLDVEGIVIDGDRLLLGLRGPVLRGWAVMLELEPDYFCDDYFTLGPIGKKGKLYRRHFFELNGLGIRDLEIVGDDLIILAGPTMSIDYRVLLLRWKNFRKRKKESVVSRDELDVILDYQDEDIAILGKNHPEGICHFRPPHDCDLPEGILITYDGPAGDHDRGNGKIGADLFPFSKKKS